MSCVIDRRFAVLTEFKLNESNASTKSTWFPYAMQNATVMHSTIALSAALLIATTPRVGHCDPALQQEGLYQKGQAMRQIREWCLQSNVSYCDSNRAAIMISISTMSTVEVSPYSWKGGHPFLRLTSA